MDHDAADLVDGGETSTIAQAPQARRLLADERHAEEALAGRDLVDVHRPVFGGLDGRQQCTVGRKIEIGDSAALSALGQAHVAGRKLDDLNREVGQRERDMLAVVGETDPVGAERDLDLGGAASDLGAILVRERAGFARRP